MHCFGSLVTSFLVRSQSFLFTLPMNSSTAHLWCQGVDLQWIGAVLLHQLCLHSTAYRTVLSGYHAWPCLAVSRWPCKISRAFQWNRSEQFKVYGIDGFTRWWKLVNDQFHVYMMIMHCFMVLQHVATCCWGQAPFFALITTTLLAFGMYLTLHWGWLAGLHHLLKASFCFGAHPQAPGVCRIETDWDGLRRIETDWDGLWILGDV